MWRYSLVLVVGFLACAQGAPEGESPDAPIVEPPDAAGADAFSGGRTDANLLAPDAPAKPDAPPPDAFVASPDAPPPPPDAPPTPDAPLTPDAPPETPDASPPDAACVPTTTNLLANPAFDLGRVSWTETTECRDAAMQPCALIVTSPDLPIAANTPAFSGWLGGYLSGSIVDPTDDELFQTVTLPPGATALQITWFMLIGTEEAAGGAFDFLEVQVRNGGGAVLQTFPRFSNLNSNTAYAQFTIAVDPGVVSANRGQPIQLYFHATTDFSQNTNFFVDTVTYDATTCP